MRISVNARIPWVFPLRPGPSKRIRGAVQRDNAATAPLKSICSESIWLKVENRNGHWHIDLRAYFSGFWTFLVDVWADDLSRFHADANVLSFILHNRLKELSRRLPLPLDRDCVGLG